MKGNLMKALGDFAEKNGRIVGGIAIVAGIFVTAAMAYKARPKVDKILEEKKEKVKAIDEDEELTDEEKAKERKETTKETVKEIAKAAAPTIISGVATAGIAIATVASGEKTIHKYMNLALAGDIAYKELYDKTRAVVGDEKATEIRKEIEEDHLKEGGDLFGPGSDRYSELYNGHLEEECIYDCGGPELFIDALSGRKFRASKTIIRDAVDRCNAALSSGQEDYITPNDFYTELGLPQIILGNDRRWDKKTMAEKLEPDMSGTASWKEGSITILDWHTRPFVRSRDDK